MAETIVRANEFDERLKLFELMRFGRVAECVENGRRNSVHDMGMFLLSEGCKGLQSIRLCGFSKVSDRRQTTSQS
ncbi:hypothetical protein ACFX15_028999 [Malus domestica]